MHTHTHTSVEPCTHVLCDRKFWQALITANCQVWPVVGHALLHRPANSIYFKFDCYKKYCRKNTASCSLNQKQILATNSLCTWHVQKAGNTHTHSHTLAVLCSILSACVWVYVCVHGHLKEIWISEFKKRWRQAGSKHSNNKNNNGAEKKEEDEKSQRK